ncbi:hypothetical protein ILUMI_08348 [Ignelater luminosus]|uniref:Mos1 transposase HTH domain-containing protein n=1 Tax=Ignelater luminosus TaxID=2038154 RepID=A0A8K0GG10_IGNLU|nr:hypothetical protein ILUMI_08348 [Ignelater luminosus]
MLAESTPRQPCRRNQLPPIRQSHQRKKAAEAHKEICKVYGVDCLTERTCQNWFKIFHSGDCFLKYEQRSGRPTEVDDDQIKIIIEEDRHITVREIAESANIAQRLATLSHGSEQRRPASRYFANTFQNDSLSYSLIAQQAN